MLFPYPGYNITINSVDKIEYKQTNGGQKGIMNFFKSLNFFLKNLGIDLGTANTIVYVDGRGYAVNEPSVIAYNSSSIMAVGTTAKDMLGRTHPGIRVIRPLADGVIADFEAGEDLIKSFIHLAEVPGYLLNRVVIGVPTGITSVEKRAVIESAQLVGARNVYLVSEPMAAAIGMGLDVMGNDAHMIVDIGGGTTDIAVINYGGIVVDNTMRIAGNEMDEALIRYLKQNYNLVIGEKTAEMVKITHGTVNGRYNRFEIRGIDCVHNLPKALILSTTVFKKAFEPVVNAITNGILETLDQLPPELAGDIVDRGIVFTGGGAMLDGLDTYLRERLGIPVSRPENALFCVAEGTRKILERFDYYKPILFQ